MTKGHGLNHYIFAPNPPSTNDKTDEKAFQREIQTLEELLPFCKDSNVTCNFGVTIPGEISSTLVDNFSKAALGGLLRNVVEQIVTAVSKGCYHISILLDDYLSYFKAYDSATAKKTTLGTVHFSIANYLMDELSRVKPAESKNVNWFLHPMYYGGKTNQNQKKAPPTQGGTFQRPFQKAEAPMDRDISQYWKDMDRNVRPGYKFFVSTLSSSEVNTSIRTNEVSSALSKYVKQHKVIILEDFPSVIPVFKAQSSASLGFSSIPYLGGYEGRHAVSSEWTDGIAFRVNPAVVTPRVCLIPLMTGFDYLLSPYTYDSSMSLKASLVANLQHDERLADEMFHLVEILPSAPGSGSMALKRFKLKKLESSVFFVETSEKLAYVKKSLSANAKLADLGKELLPCFSLLEAFLEVNFANFELEALFVEYKQNNKVEFYHGSKQQQRFDQLKKRYTEAQRKLDALLAPVLPVDRLRENLRDLNTNYLTG